ncbi:MAG: DUF4173 domain-containing protein [Runella sp.]
MKKDLLSWVALVGLHTYLFYEQNPGINALIFSVAMLGAIFWAKPELWQHQPWRWASTLHLLLAVSVAWHGEIRMPLYVLSLPLLVGLGFAPQSSLPVAGLNGGFAIFLVGLFNAIFTIRKHTTAQFQFFKNFKGSRYLLPAFITFVFYIMYSWINPAFSFDLLSFDWILDGALLFFIFLGATWICPMFFPWGFEGLVREDEKLKNDLVFSENINADRLKEENQQGILSFGAVNILLVVFLLFNVFSSAAKTYSEQVHETFWALLLSIAAAIGLIMYFFRGHQNFYENKQRLFQMAVVWIVLNGLLIAWTFYRNTSYVAAFGLTYKRIAVYVGLLLSLIGLYLTYVKLKNLKSNVYLIRQNLWVVAGAVVLGCLIDWSRLITWFNFNYADKVDVSYLLSLDKSNLPYLHQLVEKQDVRVKGFEDRIEGQVAAYKFEPSKETNWRELTYDHWRFQRFLKEASIISTK